MFAPRYFPPRYFPPRYWPPAVVVTAVQDPLFTLDAPLTPSIRAALDRGIWDRASEIPNYGEM